MRAKEQSVSCWTVEGLARVVEAAEARHITADAIQGIVLSAFTPDHVDAAVEKLLTEPGWNRQQLYVAILNTLAELEDRLSKSPRDVSMLAGRIAFMQDFAGIESADILEAAHEMAKASRGMLYVTDEATLQIVSLPLLRRGERSELACSTSILTVAAPAASRAVAAQKFDVKFGLEPADLLSLARRWPGRRSCPPAPRSRAPSSAAADWTCAQ